MSIIISKKEIKEYEKLKVISHLTLVKEKIKLFEYKYKCSLEEFKKKIETRAENFEDWDNYIEWKAYIASQLELENKLTEIDNAKDIKVV